jgi:hypothetical protein
LISTSPKKNRKVELRRQAPLEVAEVSIASPEHSDFVLDYAPTDTVRCKIPGEDAAS